MSITQAQMTQDGVEEMFKIWDAVAPEKPHGGGWHGSLRSCVDEKGGYFYACSIEDYDDDECIVVTDVRSKRLVKHLWIGRKSNTDVGVKNNSFMKKQGFVAITSDAFYRFTFASNELAIVVRHESGKETVTPIKEFSVLKNDQLLMVTLTDGEQIVFEVPQPPSVEEVRLSWKTTCPQSEWDAIPEALWQKAIAMTQEGMTLKEAWYRLYEETGTKSIAMSLLASYRRFSYDLYERVNVRTCIGELPFQFEVVGYVDVPEEARGEFFVCERYSNCVVPGEAAIKAGFPAEISTRTNVRTPGPIDYVIFVGREDGLALCCEYAVVDKTVMDKFATNRYDQHFDRMARLVKK